jgi:hypothetical protein
MAWIIGSSRETSGSVPGCKSRLRDAEAVRVSLDTVSVSLYLHEKSGNYAHRYLGQLYWEWV